jgi:hypothetical protein
MNFNVTELRRIASNVLYLENECSFKGRAALESVSEQVIVEVCTGRNFRISPGPARGAFGPSPKFIFKYVTRTPPKPEFLLFQPE